jgi:cellulose synthase/poly-beta-1,6-N-acetylglucosamine synthase-like glycosyltransferase
MIHIFGQMVQLANQNASIVLLIGLLGIISYNWRRWQRDKAMLAKRKIVPLPPLETWPGPPKVSVLVAAWNEAKNIECFLGSFLQLRYPKKELVLCAGGEDGTYELVRQWCGLRIIVLKQQPGEGKQSSLRRSLPCATGSIIYFTDADCILDDNSFERVIYPIVTGEEAVVSGSSRPSAKVLEENSFIASQAASQLYSALYTPRYADGLLGRNCAVERRLLERSRGLAEPAPSGTDFVLSKMLVRAGARIRQTPESLVVTQYPSTFREYIRQQRRWLRNVAILGHRYKALREMSTSLMTSLIGLTMLVLPFLWIFWGPLFIVIWMLLFVQVLLARSRHSLISRRFLDQPFKSLVLLAQPIFILLDFVAWSRPLFDYVLIRPYETW